MRTAHPHPFSENRKAHLQELIALIDRSGTDGLMVGQLQTIFGVKYGNTKRTVTSYLEDAEGTGQIVTDGVRWYAKEHFPRKKLSDYLLEGYVKKP